MPPQPSPPSSLLHRLAGFLTSPFVFTPLAIPLLNSIFNSLAGAPTVDLPTQLEQLQALFHNSPIGQLAIVEALSKIEWLRQIPVWVYLQLLKTVVVGLWRRQGSQFWIFLVLFFGAAMIEVSERWGESETALAAETGAELVVLEANSSVTEP